MGHTKGPWIIVGNQIHTEGKDSERKIIAHIPCPAFEPDTPDELLISAAPDLLDACKFILAQLQPEDDRPGYHQYILYSDCLHPTDDDKTVVDLLKEAISKAEGRN